MEPKSPSLNTSPESQPSAPKFEQQEIVAPDQETGPQIVQPEKEPSRHERVGETSPVTPAQQAQIPLVTPQQPTGDDTSSSIAKDDSTTPAVAADDDNIEKEWVNKAKSIIAETKSDPYLQEEKVSKLQADYLQKRYNKKVKLNSD